MSVILSLVHNDTEPIQATLADSGVAINLSGCSVSLKIATHTPTTKTGVITDAAKGVVQFPRAAGDLPIGTFRAEIMLTDGDGKEETSDLFQITVRARVD